VQPFDNVKSLTGVFNTALAVIALAMHMAGRRVAAPLRVEHGMGWWLRPLRFVAYILFGISLSFMGILAWTYYPLPEPGIANSILLAAFAWLMYWQGRHLLWLAGALLISVFSGHLVARTLNTDSFFLYSIPLGVILLWQGRVIHRPERALIESAGVIALLVGAVFEGNFENALSLTSFVLAAHLLALLVYGYVAGRRVPFACAAMLVIGAIILLVARVNIWLIPLACGLLLLAGTILAEAQAEVAERWVRGWVTRWQEWR